MSQRSELARPIPKRYIGKSSGKLDAADHTVITQLLIHRVPGWSFEVKEVLRSEAPEITTAKGNVHPGGLFITGVIGRLTCTIDGNRVVIEEAGGVENAALKDGDGERLKHAMSDALKRCAMRVGLGLHIWAQGMYFLDRALATQQEEQEVDPERPPVGETAPDPEPAPDVPPPPPVAPVAVPPRPQDTPPAPSTPDPVPEAEIGTQPGEGRPYSGPPPAADKYQAPKPPPPNGPPGRPIPGSRDDLAIKAAEEAAVAEQSSGDGLPVPDDYWPADEEITNLKGRALQTALREAGLEVAGTVPELRDRLRAHVLYMLRVRDGIIEDPDGGEAEEEAQAPSGDDDSPPSAVNENEDPDDGDEYTELEGSPISAIQLDVVREVLESLDSTTARAYAAYKRGQRLPDKIESWNMAQAMRVTEFVGELMDEMAAAQG